MYRYFQQTKHDGSLKCTKEALEMYQSKGGCTLAYLSCQSVELRTTSTHLVWIHNISGEKLAELLNRHGNFAKVEVALKKWHERKARFDKKGGWYTKAWLAGERHWTKCLSYACMCLVSSLHMF